MQRLPTVAIVGRPNVGKSTLFNQLVGRRIAITDPTAGTTRDRIFHPMEWHDPDEHLRRFELIDTGGLGIVDRQDLSDLIERQIDVAIGSADVLVFMVDAQEGVTPLDEIVASRLRRTGLPVLLIANKCDELSFDDRAYEFYNLNLGDPLPLSSAHRRNLDEMLDRLVALLPTGLAGHIETDPRDILKLAVVGRRNAGKSTFVNALVGDERVIASDKPGTTRDSVDVRIEREGETFLLIDTAGTRRMTSLETSIEFFAAARTERAVRRADVVMLLLDAREDVGDLDKKLVERTLLLGKPMIIVLSKWDLTDPEMAAADYEEYIGRKFPKARFVPIIAISAVEHINLWESIDLARELWQQCRQRHQTAEINRVLREAIAAHSPAARRGKLPKAYYATQVATQPPTFAVFVNDVRMFTDDYRRYLAGRLREGLEIPEVPVRVAFKPRQRKGRRRRPAPMSLTLEGMMPRGEEALDVAAAEERANEADWDEMDIEPRVYDEMEAALAEQGDVEETDAEEPDETDDAPGRQ
jgi:GTP-binding protein